MRDLKPGDRGGSVSFLGARGGGAGPKLFGLDIGEPVRTVELPGEEPLALPEPEADPAESEREPEPAAPAR